MDLEEERRFGTDRRFVVREMGPVGRPDFGETDAGALHDRGNTERTPDLDELTPGHDHLPPEGEGVEREKDRRRAVVDDVRGLGPGQGQQLRFEGAHPEVELEIGVAVEGAGDGGSRDWGHRRPAEIRVEHDARRVDHRSRVGDREPLRRSGHRPLEPREVRGLAAKAGFPIGNFRAHGLERITRCAKDGPLRKIGARSPHLGDQAIHGRQHPAGIRVDLFLRTHTLNPIFTRPDRLVFWIEIAGGSSPQRPGSGVDAR